jgi:hypothetical protein
LDTFFIKIYLALISGGTLLFMDGNLYSCGGEGSDVHNGRTCLQLVKPVNSKEPVWITHGELEFTAPRSMSAHVITSNGVVFVRYF